MKVIGFTGTQTGMSSPQYDTLMSYLSFYKTEGAEIFHHGDCIGADMQAHRIAENMGYEIIIHPPSNPLKQANCISKTILPPLPYKVRNRAIVDACDILIATPRGYEASWPYSGTWSTVRYAKNVGKPVVIIFPSGVVELPSRKENTQHDQI